MVSSQFNIIHIYKFHHTKGECLNFPMKAGTPTFPKRLQLQLINNTYVIFIYNALTDSTEKMSSKSKGQNLQEKK